MLLLSLMLLGSKLREWELAEAEPLHNPHFLRRAHKKEPNSSLKKSHYLLTLFCIFSLWFNIKTMSDYYIKVILSMFFLKPMYFSIMYWLLKWYWVNYMIPSCYKSGRPTNAEEEWASESLCVMKSNHIPWICIQGWPFNVWLQANSMLGLPFPQ